MVDTNQPITRVLRSSSIHMEVARKDKQQHMQQGKIILFHMSKGHIDMDKILQSH